MTPVNQLVTSKSEQVTRNKLTSLEVKLRVLEIGKGLLSTEPPNNMTGWYCQCFIALGEAKFSAIASMARDPSVRKPKSVFGKNLSEEMKAQKLRRI